MIENILDESALEELKKLNVKILGVIGKGHRGVVLKGIYKNKEVAIKIPRRDAPKNNLLNEALILKKIEKFNFSPKVYAYGKNYIIMEYINGEELKKIVDKLNKEELIKVVKDILKITLILDLEGIEHKEIQGGRHFLIGDKVYIIDFEKAKEKRTFKNFTSALSMLFVDGYIAKIVKEKIEVDDNFIREFGKFYKKLFR